MNTLNFTSDYQINNSNHIVPDLNLFEFDIKNRLNNLSFDYKN